MQFLKVRGDRGTHARASADTNHRIRRFNGESRMINLIHQRMLCLAAVLVFASPLAASDLHSSVPISITNGEMVVC